MYSTLREYMGLLHNYQQLHLCCSASAHDNMTLPTIYNHTEYCLIVYATNLCNCNVTPFLFIWILVLPLSLVMYYSSLSIWVDSMHMCDVLTTWLFFLAITLRYSVFEFAIQIVYILVCLVAHFWLTILTTHCGNVLHACVN